MLSEGSSVPENPKHHLRVRLRRATGTVQPVRRVRFRACAQALLSVQYARMCFDVTQLIVKIDRQLLMLEDHRPKSYPTGTLGLQ